MKKIYLLILAACSIISAAALAPKDLKIYLNPGHGGHDSDDRNVAVPPFEAGDPNGYWESNSNLDKGLDLRDLLLARGYQVNISRTTNTTADDLGLSTIGGLANNWGADIFLSIHSNATGTANRRNSPLMLFRGYDNEPVYPESVVFAEFVNDQLLENKATVWTSTSRNIRGDWSFYDWGTQGLGVLRTLQMKGMLSEGSFHDYIPETYRLLNKDFCWMEAWHFMTAFDQYFKMENPETKGIVAGIAYDSRFPRGETYIMFDRDNNMPLMGAVIDLIDANGANVQTYTTDQYYNGFFLFKDVMPGNYTVKVTEKGHITKEESVVVESNKISYAIVPVVKIRDTPPVVVSYSPVWKDGDEPILCNTPITITFNWDMDIESTNKAITITPAVKGVYKWNETNLTVTFEPTEPFAANTLYTVTVGKGAKHAGDMSLENEFSFNFMTDSRPYLSVVNYWPREGSIVNTKNPGIYFLSDKPMNTEYARKIVATDANGSEVAISTRTVKYNKNTDEYGWIKLPFLKDLSAGEYTLSVPQEVADNKGIELKDAITCKFTVEDMTVATSNAVEVEGFESVDGFTVNADNTISATAKLAKESTNKLFGSAALATTYSMTAESGKVELDMSDKGETFTSNDILELRVYGDLSENNINLIMSDSQGDVTVPLCNVDFFGWQTKNVNLGQYLTSESAYSVKGIEIVVGHAPQSLDGGKIIFDSMSKLANQGGANLVEDGDISVTVGPNPASEYIVANGDSWISSVKLYDMNGKLVAERDGNVINVSEISDGAYVIRIYIGDIVVAKTVLVSHK